MSLRVLSDVKILVGNCLNHPGDFTEWKSRCLGYYIVAKAMGCKDKNWLADIEKNLGFMGESVRGEFCGFCKKMFKLFSKIVSGEKDEFYPKFYQGIYAKYIEKNDVFYEDFVLRALPGGYNLAKCKENTEAYKLNIAAGVVRDCGNAVIRYTADTVLVGKIREQLEYVLDAFYNCYDKRD